MSDTITATLINTGILAFAGFIVFLILMAKRKEKQRSIDLEKLSKRLNMTFSKDYNHELLTEMKVFDLFNKGHSQVIWNTMEYERDEIRMRYFDYRYRIGAGKNQSTHLFSVVTVKSDSLTVPKFALRKEGFFDRIGAAMGFDDIDFPENEQFSSLYMLKSNDEKNTREFFDRKLLDFFVTNPELSVECVPGMFMHAVHGRKNIEEVDNFIQEGLLIYKELLERIKRD